MLRIDKKPNSSHSFASQTFAIRDDPLILSKCAVKLSYFGPARLPSGLRLLATESRFVDPGRTACYRVLYSSE